MPASAARPAPTRVPTAAASAAPGQRSKPPTKQVSVHRGLLWATVAVFFTLYAALPISNYLRFRAPSFDLSIFTQIVSGYARLQAPIAEIKGPGFNALGDHFHPLLVLLAPFYALFSTPVTLLVAQAALFALSIVPITRAAARRLGARAGSAVGVAYGLSWGLQTAAAVDFHEIAFAVPLLAFGLEALLDKRWTAVVAWCAPLVLVKEDLGLTVAVIGLVLVLRGQRRLGAWLCGYGFTATALTVLVLIPAVNGEQHYAYWSKLRGASTAASTSVSQWLLGLPAELFAPSIKAVTIGCLLGVTAFLALRSPLVLVTVPTLAWRFLSDKSAYWGPGWHYDAILMPILFLAFVDAAVILRESKPRWLRALGRFSPGAVLIVAVLLAPLLPMRDLVDPVTYRPSPRADAAHAVLDLIPSGSSVETDQALMAHLVTRTRVFWLRNAHPVEPDFILLDRRARSAAAPPTRQPLSEYVRALHPQAHYTLIYSQDGYNLLQRQRF